MIASVKHRYWKEFLEHYELELSLDFNINQDSYQWCVRKLHCYSHFGRSPREAIQNAMRTRGIRFPHGHRQWVTWFEIRDRDIAARALTKLTL